MRSLLTRAVLICVIYPNLLQSRTTTRDCPTDYIQMNWNFSKDASRPVQNITQDLLEHGKYLQVKVENVTQNVTIILIAMPDVKDWHSCPSRYQLDEHLPDIRRHRCTYHVGEGATLSKRYGMIFTGCYYTVIRNEKRGSWIVGPEYFETDYTYLNAKVKVAKCEVRPADQNRNKELLTELYLPLACSTVDASLYELEGRIENITDETLRSTITSRKLKSKQDCAISKDGNERVKTSCERSKLNTNLTIKVGKLVVKESEWTTVIKWSNLPSGGYTYFLQFSLRVNKCHPGLEHEYQLDTTWKRFVHDTFCDLDGRYLNNDNRPGSDGNPESFNRMVVVLPVVGVAVMAILVYWIFKFFRLRPMSKAGQNESSERREGTYYAYKSEIRSDQVLLIHARDSPLLTDAMNNFREHLTRDCHCQVHDLYVTDDWADIQELGAAGWAEKLLRDGSKVIWVDTPRLRSRLNDKEKTHTTGDCREDVIPHAVSLAKDSFQNATTQYRRHFVVRVEGFEVDDGQDDPLLVVSPHTRYHIPTHLSLLVEDLKGRPQSSENPATNQV